MENFKNFLTQGLIKVALGLLFGFWIGFILGVVVGGVSGIYQAIHTGFYSDASGVSGFIMGLYFAPIGFMMSLAMVFCERKEDTPLLWMIIGGLGAGLAMPLQLLQKGLSVMSVDVVMSLILTALPGALMAALIKKLFPNQIEWIPWKGTLLRAALALFLIFLSASLSFMYIRHAFDD